jgi:RNA polymerase sigma factor (sigma-70 family)
VAVLGTNAAGRDPVKDLEAYLRKEYSRGVPLRLTVRHPSATGYELSERIVSRLEVANALRWLPYRQRRVVELCYEQDLPAAEVGRLLGVSERTVYADRDKALNEMTRIIYQEAA